MQFLFPTLTIGFLFLAVPPLVHLINRLRHRRQRWAAMEFLLDSYRRQRNWIFLRQLLLLLCRVAVAAALVGMLAGWLGGARWLDALGGRTTHHVVILDDSYSMADRSGGASAHARAVAALDGLTRRLSDAEGTHQLTVLRSSRAALITRAGSDAADAAADLSAVTLTRDSEVAARVVGTAPSSMATDLVPALRLAGDLVDSTAADQTVLYVMSDFRQRDWSGSEAASEAVQRIARSGAQLRMIDCAAPPASNLGITRLQPVPDVWVAGVPVVVEVAVKNYGSAPVRNVTLSARVVRYERGATTLDAAQRFSGQVESLPGLVIDALGPGEEITRQFQVYVASPGTHAVEVELPEDALAIDNRRVCTLPLSDAQRVLIIDAEGGGGGAYALASVLDPGSQVRTGAVPDIQPPSFLRSATADTLARYRGIYLVDLPEVDDRSAELLEQYVRAGGGLLWWLGAQVRQDRYNELLLGRGRRLLPAPLAGIDALRDEASDRGASSDAPDLVLGDPHPITEPLAAVGDAALRLVRLSRATRLSSETRFGEESFAAPGDEPSRESGATAVLLRRGDGRPLAVQHDVGSGRVVTMLTSLDDGWTNWTGDPSFVVLMLRANAYLWSAASPSTSRLVDQPAAITLNLQNHTRTLNYLPAVDQPPRVPIEEQAEPSDRGDDLLRWELDPRAAVIEGRSEVDAMLAPGISEIWLTRNDGSTEARPLASVVEPGGGDLARADRGEIRQGVRPANVAFFDAEEIAASAEGPAGGGMTTLVLLALLGVLLAGEQCLGYWASYHPPRRGSTG